MPLDISEHETVSFHQTKLSNPLLTVTFQKKTNQSLVTVLMKKQHNTELSWKWLHACMHYRALSVIRTHHTSLMATFQFNRRSYSVIL